MATQKLPNYLDGRGARGIFSRGTAHYGPSRAPKPGNIKKVQKVARRKLKEIQSRQRAQ